MRHPWIDALRTAAISGVVMIHCAAAILYDQRLFLTVDWHLANILNSFSRFSVPLFLLLTGYLVLRKPVESIPFRKIVFRILMPFFFYACIHLVIYLAIFDDFTGKSINKLLSSGISYHFWYVYLITAGYLLLPVLSALVHRFPTLLNTALLVWPFTFVLALPEVKQQIPGAGAFYMASHLGYLLLGFKLSTWKKFSDVAAWLIFISGGIITAATTFYYSSLNGKFYSLYYLYLAPGVLLSAAGLFLKFQHRKMAESVWLQKISHNSYGIYLVHVIVLEMVLRAAGTPLTIVAMLLFYAITLLVSIFLIDVVHRLPLGKYVSGKSH